MAQPVNGNPQILIENPNAGMWIFFQPNPWMEIPDFNELYTMYNDKGLEILSISISDSREQLMKFKNAYNMFYPILYGEQKIMMKIQREYGGIYSIPMSFLINKKGEIIRIYPGAIIKQFDPNIYTDLILHIEDALVK